MARGAEAHGSGGRGLSIREITCLFAQNQQSCLLYRNNVDDYKSIIVTPAYFAQRREPFRDRRGPTDQSLTILSGRGGFAGSGGGSGSLIGANGPGRPDAKIDVFETATFERRVSISLGYGQVTRLAFSPRGRFLAAAQSDGTVLVYDLLVQSTPKRPSN